MAIKKYLHYFILVVILLIFVDIICSYFLFYRPIFSHEKNGWTPSVVIVSKMYPKIVRRMAPSSALEQCRDGAQPKFYHYDETYGYGHSQGRYIFTNCPTWESPNKTYEWVATIDEDGARQTSHTQVTKAKRMFSATALYLVGL